MDTLSLRKNHITFTSGNDIAEICKPLIHLDITSFNYVKTFEDGSQINLSNRTSWLEHFYDNKFYLIGAFENHPNQYASGFALWPHLSGQKIFYDARTYFNIDHGITIIEKQKDSCEFYYFGTTTNNHKLVNFYINNIDLLQRFIFFFKDKAALLLKKANKDRIILENHFESTASLNFDNSIIIPDRKINEFFENTAIKNFQLSGSVEGETITSKQLRCIIYLLEGKTAKEIAKKLGLSFRTVEGHINKLKNKFECHTKNELINKLLKNGLGFQFDIYNKIL